LWDAWRGLGMREKPSYHRFIEPSLTLEERGVNMKHLRLTFYLGMALLMILMACAPSTSTQTAPPPAGNEAGSSSAQASSESSPSASPVNLAPPEMKVGSTFLYADGSLLVAVPAGPFTMGQGGIDNPIHQVTLSDFWIYRTKVTNAQFAYCVSQGGCTPPNPRNNKGYADPLKSQDPVTGVKYDQAAAYCAFVHGRLPTEAEWEKAARGPDGNIYPWGDGSPTCDLLNFNDCTGGTTRVNQYPQGKSYYTAFDMEGNTFEWTADWYKADYYSISPANDPTGPEKGSQRSVRSSAFNSGGNQTPAAMRFFSRPEDDRANLGFRCVVLDPTYFAPFCNYPATYDTDGVGGGPSGPQTKVDCPSLGIQQTPGCNENNPSTIVTFNGPSGSTITAPPPPGCQPTNNPNQYTCTKDGTLQICSSCTVTTTSQPQCPDGYAYDAASKSCIPNHGSS